MKKEIKKYIPIADFLATVLGKNTEILIHDFENYQESIVYIVNGHISNRKIGDSITNLILEFLQNEAKDNNQFICNYNSKTSSGKVLNSSTFFIRDDNNHPIGALCLNSDYSDMHSSLTMIKSFFPNFVANTPIDVKENLSSDSGQLTLDKINSVVDNFAVTPERMTIDEKMSIITQLNEYGIFMLRGSVQEVANKLNMSEPSVYRYLKKIKN